jgi:hypothetical protein
METNPKRLYPLQKQAQAKKTLLLHNYLIFKNLIFQPNRPDRKNHGNVKVGIGYSASNLLVYDFDSQMECDQ